MSAATKFPPCTMYRIKKLCTLSMICSSTLFAAPLSVHAGPSGGQIVGGTGQISQSTLTTTIQQNTSSMAINWDSYNLDRNEVINYLQPSASAISLNRILDLSGSTIHGQINGAKCPWAPGCNPFAVHRAGGKGSDCLWKKMFVGSERFLLCNTGCLICNPKCRRGGAIQLNWPLVRI